MKSLETQQDSDSARRFESRWGRHSQVFEVNGLATRGHDPDACGDFLETLWLGAEGERAGLWNQSDHLMRRGEVARSRAQRAVSSRWRVQVDLLGCDIVLQRKRWRCGRRKQS
jgi:hypothetical protein